MTHFTLTENRHGRTSSALRRIVFTAIAGILSLGAGVAAVSAKDLSLPYRNYPGFVCHAWNRMNECVDFSYNENSNVNSSPYYNNQNYNYYTDPYYNNSPYYNSSNYNCANGYYGANCYGNVTVRVTGSPNPVSAGELVTYRLYVRNDSSMDRTVDVRATLDRDTTFSSASDRGYRYRTTEARWDRLLVRRNADITLTLTVRVNSGIRDGDTIRLNASVDGMQDTVVTDVREDRYGYGTNCYDRYGRYDVRYCTESGRSCYDQYGRYNARLCSGSSSSYGDCYDAYGRYDVRYCDNSYSYECDDRYGDCRLTVDVRASDTEVSPGELITYTVTLRNDDTAGRSIDVVGILDPIAILYSASDGGSLYRASEVRWNNIYVGARATRTVTATARVDQRYGSYRDIVFSARADGEDDEVTVRVR